VTTLLDSPHRDPAWPRGTLVGLVVLLVAVSPALHHAIETVLSLLAHP
jgi:hypothetical protein